MKKRVALNWALAALIAIIILYPWMILYWNNIDFDNDGLSHYEEKRKGTSDYSYDTDNDGVPDPLDMHPTGGDLNIVKYHEWYVSGQRFYNRLQIKEDKYIYYMEISGQNDRDYVTAQEPEILKVLNSIKESAKGTNVTVKQSIIAFVQALPYSLDIYSGYDEYHKFPVQTLVEGTGDCEDKVFLAASLLKAQGEDVVILYFPGEHYALGVSCTQGCAGKKYVYHLKEYYYLETISSDYSIGQIPKGFSEKQPVIIEP